VSEYWSTSFGSKNKYKMHSWFKTQNEEGKENSRTSESMPRQFETVFVKLYPMYDVIRSVINGTLPITWYSEINQSIPDVTVNRKDGGERSKTLHRNLLLPVGNEMERPPLQSKRNSEAK
jgi:hypothetical protein